VQTLCTALAGHGYDVRTAGDVVSAMSKFDEWHPKLVITELVMPGANGLDLCRRVRKASNVPVIVVSGRSDERAKLAAFEMGADDYVTKPFGLDEMLARVRVAFRRSGLAPDSTALTVGAFRIDFDARRIHLGGEPIRLTPKEFDLFVFMARHPNRVLTHSTLLGAVWGEAFLQQPEYLRVFFGQLRKKLEPDPSKPKYLVTEPWVGYKFNPSGTIQ